MSNNSFENSFKKLILVEGGYVNNPLDKGGKTKYGITEVVAREHGFKGAMTELTLEDAKAIYKKSYWDIFGLDDTPEKLAEEIFESAVNCGPGRVSTWVLKTAMALSKTPLSSVKDALEMLKDPKDSETILKMINVFQGGHYLAIIEKSPEQKIFIRGWFKRVKLCQ